MTAGGNANLFAFFNCLQFHFAIDHRQPKISISYLGRDSLLQVVLCYTKYSIYNGLYGNATVLLKSQLFLYFALKFYLPCCCVVFFVELLAELSQI